MKAEKMPSGKWRVRVYLGQDGEGKKHVKSVSAATKQEAMRKAMLVTDRVSAEDLRVDEACLRFLSARRQELSPSTVRGYESTYRVYIHPDKIAAMRIFDLKAPVVQEWVSRFPRGMSSKTKKNHLGFLLTVVGYFCEGRRIRVRIKETEPRELYTPTMDEVNRVLAASDPILKRAILLGLFGMRRGEICALEASDIDRRKCLIRITKSLAKTTNGDWVVKTPKTRSSVRWVEIPRSVVEILPVEGKVVPVSPDIITCRFWKVVRRSGVTPFRFHDLRAFFASIAVSSAIGAGELTVQEIGGWKTNHVLKKHYERSISEQRQRDTDRILEWFGDHLKMGS